MTVLSALWLPILLSAVAVFLLSSIINTMLWHASDYPAVGNQDKILDAFRALDIPPGDYMLPRPTTRAEMNTPEFKAKMDKGPIVAMTVWPNGPLNMGKSLVLWFVYCLVVSACAAYVAGRALTPEAGGLAVFRFAGTAAFLAYSGALWQQSIWFGRKWSTTIKFAVDGLLYAVATAAVFAWLWPR